MKNDLNVVLMSCIREFEYDIIHDKFFSCGGPQGPRSPAPSPERDGPSTVAVAGRGGRGSSARSARTSRCVVPLVAELIKGDLDRPERARGGRVDAGSGASCP